MKPKSSLRLFLLAAGSSLLAIASASADQTWDGGSATDSNWNTADNWGSNTLPNFANQIIFAGTTRTATVNNLAADTTIGGFNFTNSTSGQTFSTSGNRINDTDVCVVSNCDEIRLLQETDGSASLPSETRKPDADYALNHPPFHFKVSPQATTLKAEGLVGGKMVTSYVWKKPGAPARLILQADRREITADGSDISRIIVSAVDENGTEVPTGTHEVSFKITGNGQLVGENPVKLRAGKMIILAQSSFVPGDIQIIATAEGLTSASTTVSTRPLAPGVDMPSKLPTNQPANKPLIRGDGSPIVLKPQVLAFVPQQNVEPNAWIESNPIMLDNAASLSITGGEYRIYTSPWTGKSGNAVGGDAIFVRLKSSATPGGTAAAELTVGSKKVAFSATTRR
jgi:hypothetical protein